MMLTGMLECNGNGRSPFHCNIQISSFVIHPWEELGVKVGAHYLGKGECEFIVWAPELQKIEVEILSPEPQTIRMKPQVEGYWQAIATETYPGSLYQYRLNDQDRYPDPASYYQPQGVHGSSQVIDPLFPWTDSEWRGIPLASLICYELHVGTFTPEGTFAAIIERLPELRDIGINAIELMPIAQFPGDNHSDPTLAYRNWGYDGVFPFAVQNSYGSPQDLKQLVNACHRHGIAVVLDVVYNHFGPEGNIMAQFAPYFTETYRGPWGNAMNFDDAYSPGVRQYFIQNALYWLREFHIDGLRLDAVQAIYDLGAKHILQELAEAVEQFSQAESAWPRFLIAESDLNNAMIIRPPEQGGFGLDAQWCDDFHHALHGLLTGDQQGYYQDFGRCADLGKSYELSFVYDWKYAPHRRRFHGMPCGDRPPTQFVVFIQNHDQVGNQLKGDRLSQRISFEGLKLAAGAVLLSPYIPLLFMGEEYGETAPFTYFVSHSDPDLIQLVRKGRQKEFEAFHYDEAPPDPEAVETFLHCKLNWSLRQEGTHAILLNWYRHLIQLRQTHPVLLNRDRRCIQTTALEEKRVLMISRWQGNHEILLVLNFSDSPVSFTLPVKYPLWKRLDSADPQWGGSGSPSLQHLTLGQPLTLAPTSLVLYENIFHPLS